MTLTNVLSSSSDSEGCDVTLQLLKRCPSGIAFEGLKGSAVKDLDCGEQRKVSRGPYG